MRFVACLVVALAIFSAKASGQKKDGSHTVKQAIEHGAPSLEKQWTYEDYKAFNTYLKTLPLNTYPKLENSKSKVLFAKVMSSTKQSVLTSNSLTSEQVMSNVVNLQTELKGILLTYYLV